MNSSERSLQGTKILNLLSVNFTLHRSRGNPIVLFMSLQPSTYTFIEPFASAVVYKSLVETHSNILMNPFNFLSLVRVTPGKVSQPFHSNVVTQRNDYVDSIVMTLLFSVLLSWCNE